MKRRLKRFLTVAVLLLGLVGLGNAAPIGATPSDNVKARIVEFYGRAPLTFEDRQGKGDGRAAFISRGNGCSIFLSPAEATVVLRTEKPSDTNRVKSASTSHKADVVRINLVDSEETARAAAIDPRLGNLNYCIGNDPQHWHRSGPAYPRVKYENVYPGVDLVYYGNQQELEFDFILAPGANPLRIALQFKGADKLELDAQGNLLVSTASGQKLLLQKPFIYQDVNGTRQEVQGGYTLGKNQRVGFQIAAYDKTKSLIIDPILQFSTYLGGSGNDTATGIAVDEAGTIYVGGFTSNPDIAALSGSTKLPASTLGFVRAYKRDGTQYTTILGTFEPAGTAVTAIAADVRGIYVTGNTRSTPKNFSIWSQDPHNSSTAISQAGASPLRDHMIDGANHAFFVMLKPDDGTMLLSTIFGGNGPLKNPDGSPAPDSDVGLGIAVNKNADKPGETNVYITGNTTSPKLETVPSAIDVTDTKNTYGGGTGYGDAFVAKITLSAGTPVFGYYRYLGGSGDEDNNGLGAGAIAVDTQGNAYVTGSTESDDFFLRFPQLQPGAFQKTKRKKSDAFLVKIDSDGNWVYATYLGGDGIDVGTGVAVDDNFNAYVTGYATDFTTGFPFITRLPSNDGNNVLNVFVAKFDASGGSLLYATLLGGDGTGRAIAVGHGPNPPAYITGKSRSLLIVNGIQPTGVTVAGDGSTRDAFVAELAWNGSLIYSTYLGGTKEDEGRGIAVDSGGNAYVSGYTESSVDFRLAHPSQATFGGGVAPIPSDAFVAIIAPDQLTDCCTNYWRLDGNAGTTAGPNFLGTTDNNPLELKVDGVRALRLEPIPPLDQSGLFSIGINVIGGSESNSAALGIYGATIAGGGNTGASEFDQPEPNTVSGNYGTIGGGLGNTSIGFASAVGGGEGNSSAGRNSVIAGGAGNQTGTDTSYSSIGGGNANEISGSQSVIGGGVGNRALSFSSTIGGGVGNTTWVGSYGTIGGGNQNAAGPSAVIGGGERNEAVELSTVGGGSSNSANGRLSFVGGGNRNVATGHASTIAGGDSNVASDEGGTIGGGLANQAVGRSATVPGGVDNLASGDFSFAAGRRAQALGKGSFVWADSSGGPYSSFRDDEFRIRAAGGVRVKGDIYCDGNYFIQNPDGSYRSLSAPHGSGPPWWLFLVLGLSDKRLKEKITTIPNAVEMLGRLHGVSFYWNEKGKERLTRNIEKNWRSASGSPEDNKKLWEEKRKATNELLSRRQIGFVAQDVEKVFPDWVATDEEGYKQIDMQHLDAVLVDAVKEQQAQIEAQQKEIAELKDTQRRAAAGWEERFKRLEKSVARTADKSAATPPGSR